MGKGSDYDLSSAVVAALPKDPDQQLQVAQQVVQYAVSGRVAKLEAETSSLRSKIAEKDAVIGSLQTRVFGAETTLAETTAKLTLAMEGQAKLIKDNDVLSSQVKKLMCQVSKLDDFKKALMKSLEASSECGGDSADDGKEPCRPPASPYGTSLSPEPKSDSPPFPKRESEGPFSCRKSDCPESPESPPAASDKSVGLDPDQSASSKWSPWHLSKSSLGPLTPRIPSDSFGTAARSPRVDGKEFFRQARNRLSFEQFSEFLTNIKELNAHRQTREETKQKSTVIFGPDNFDLTEKFSALLCR